MNSYNVYSSPEEYGLEIIHTLEDPHASYDFAMFVIWEEGTGRLFYGEDSGCSCPTPFESFYKLEDLQELTKENWPEFREELVGFCDRYGIDAATRADVLHDMKQRAGVYE